jgi:hypothetical protein
MNSEDDLRRAEELVAEGRRIVQQQKGRILRLRAAGVDTRDAQRTLHLGSWTPRSLPPQVAALVRKLPGT